MDINRNFVHSGLKQRATRATVTTNSTSTYIKELHCRCYRVLGHVFGTTHMPGTVFGDLAAAPTAAHRRLLNEAPMAPLVVVAVSWTHKVVASPRRAGH
jgi:hypothetical protein